MQHTTVLGYKKYSFDNNGDVTNLLDGKGGIIGSYYYDAFGNVQENTSTFSNPYRYAGYQYDEEIGKYYLLNRMYDPESARFMQEDTYRGNANDPLSLNLYTYVNNNPMIYDDQNGHWPSFIDNFVSSVKSVASSAWSYVKETASNIYNTVSSAVSYVSSGLSYAKDTVYNWGKQTVNNIRKTYNTAKTVYNKVVKPVVTNYVKQKVEEVKTGIAVKAGEVANFVKNINVPQLVFGGISVGVGALATVTGVGLMAVPGLQLVGAGIIAAGVGSIAYGAGEMLDSTAHINPIRDFAVTKLGMSNVEYDLTGAVLTGISGFGIAGYGGLAAAGRAAMKSQANNAEVKNEIIPQVVAGENVEIMPKTGNKPVLGMCFTKDTIVKVKDGDKQIKDIKIGDMVYSENIETGEKGYKAVKQVFVNDASNLLHIKVKDTVINTTSPHPFYVIGKGWVAAKDLVVGDVLKLASGDTTEIIDIKVEKLENPVKVYNFEVEDWHTYYVSEYGVLVHNTGANPCSQEASNADTIKNWMGEDVKIPQGHKMSPRDPSFSEPPIYREGPYTSEQREAFLGGEAAGTKLAPHHRHQIPVRDGGVIDELPGPGHPEGNIHTGGSPSRHPAKSIFNSETNGNKSRQSEIADFWKSKGQRLIEVEDGVWIDPGFK